VLPAGLLPRRSPNLIGSPAEGYAFGGVQVYSRRAEVTRDGRAIELSGLELKLLRHLVEHRGAVLARDELLDKVWGYDATPVTRTVDVHIASLRQKLEANPGRREFIVTVHRLGYKVPRLSRRASCWLPISPGRIDARNGLSSSAR